MSSARWPRYAAAVAGFAWFLYIGGIGTLNPLKFDWILIGDWQQHWLGSLFFRREPWTFPLGTVHALLYPIGTNIGFTDSNPLLSILLKPFSRWLPEECQFIGPWLALCFTLQGYVGAALASTVTTNRVAQFLGGSLIALSPVLAARVGHDTLCAQWILLGIMYLGLRDYSDGQGVRRHANLAAGAAMLSAAIHPYLATMCFVLAQACFLRLWWAELITPRRAWAMAFVTTLGVFAVFFAVGYFGEADAGSSGFGIYRADLLAFFDPREFSRVLPDLHTAGGYWEGLGCLGLGGVIAAGIAAIMWFRTRPTLSAGTAIVVTACVLMGIYALGPNITVAGRPFARVTKLYSHLGFITGPFRASGRFIWPVHYLALLGGIWGVMRLLPARRAAFAPAILAVVVAVEAADYLPARWMLEDKHFREAPSDVFAVAKGGYRHMALYPMEVVNACGDFQEEHVYRFMLAAYRAHTTFNSGVFARLPAVKTQELCANSDSDVGAGKFDSQTIYVVSKFMASWLKEKGAVCAGFAGDWICVSPDSDEKFRTYLTTGHLVERK